MPIRSAKGRILLFISSWIVLFAITVIVRRIGASEAEASAQSVADVYRSAVRQIQDARLNGMPLQGKGTYREIIDFPELGETIRQGTIASADQIQGCVTQTMRQSHRETEKFEFSFRVRNFDGKARPVDLLLERATAEFKTTEVDCILDVISKIDLGNGAEVNTPVLYPMCIANRT